MRDWLRTFVSVGKRGPVTRAAVFGATVVETSRTRPGASSIPTTLTFTN